MNLVKHLSRVVDHFFPEFNQWLFEIKDHRNLTMIIYQQKALIWTGIMMFLTGQGSRNQINLELRKEDCHEGIKELSGQKNLKQTPHGDTLEYYIRKVMLEDFECVNCKMIQQLIRKRSIEGCRLQGYYLVAIDGVHVCTFNYEHCPNCIKRKNKNGKIQWQHYKVQASLVTPNGLCLPMSSQWIENEEFYNKQDCEQKAAKRLLKKIRKLYPQLKICVLMDSLYANEPMFKAVEEQRMEWIIVFKKGRMSEVYVWLKKIMQECGKSNYLETERNNVIGARVRRDHYQRVERERICTGNREQKIRKGYQWGTNIGHWSNSRRYNILSCKETIDDKVKCHYTWLVSQGIKLNEKTVAKVSQAGRCRWKIENEGNNVQKNGGYKLEHQYSRDEVSMKVWIALLDISHILGQLMEKSLFKHKEFFNSSKNIAKRLYEHLRYRIFKKPEQWPKQQIRLFQGYVNFGWDTS